MSLTRFFRESTSLLGTYDASTHKHDVERSHEAVRDRWLAEKKFSAIVAAILGNWTSGNCVEFMLPVTAKLLASGELALHQKLWTRTIKRQVDTFFREYAYLRGERLTFEDLMSTDSSQFDEFDWASYDDKRVASSFLLKRLATSLSTWREELEAHHENTAQADQIAATIQALKRPRIEVPR